MTPSSPRWLQPSALSSVLRDGFTELRDSLSLGAEPWWLKLDAPDASRTSRRRPRALLDAVIDFHQRAALERLLALARAVSALVIFLSLASNVGQLHPLSAKVTSGAYVVYAALIFLSVQRRPDALLRVPNRLHILDFAWATVVTTVSGGPSGHAFPLFAFVLVAAAYRWGLHRTILDAVAIVMIVLAQSLLALFGITPWPFELDWLVLWAAYLLVLAALFGGLSERMHALSFQAVALGHVMSQVGQSTGVASALRYTLREILRLFGAREVFLIAEEADSKRLFVWHAAAEAAAPIALSNEQAPEHEQLAWMFSVPPQVGAFEVRMRGGAGAPAVALTLDADGNVIESTFAAPTELPGARSWHLMIAIAMELRQEWRVRLYLCDPTSRPGGQLRLGFLQNLLRQVAPVLLDLYLLRGLRARAGSRERARLSRELHDGVIQSLVGLEMRLDVVRRNLEATAPALTADVTAVRDLLHEEALRVRELMQRLRATEVDSERLPHELEDLLERFFRNTGIEARLDWAVRMLDLSPRQCREVSFIIQEALVNVRRHSGASKVAVRVEADVEEWRLIVTDNGRGFGFAGRLTDEELRSRSWGPRVIRERISAMRGSLTVESSAQGTSLEMTFPFRRD